MNMNSPFESITTSLKSTEKMPVVFIGHGNPMNAIEENDFTHSWQQFGVDVPKPQAILVISAHWLTTNKVLVDVSDSPRMIYDFYGFPKALHEVTYDAIGAPDIAAEVTQLLAPFDAEQDTRWGLDHGAWSVLKFLFPAADVPVFQISIDMAKDLPWHLDVGKALAALRERGVLILGSGNLVHNLKALSFSGEAHKWATEFDQRVAKKLANRQFNELSDAESFGGLMKLANPSLEHYIPALIIAGASDSTDTLRFITEGIDLGSISMRSFVFYKA